MGKLIYAINTSLDGFTEDPTGAFDWSVLTRTYMSSTTNGYAASALNCLGVAWQDVLLPVALGAGKPALPTNLRLDFELRTGDDGQIRQSSNGALAELLQHSRQHETQDGAAYLLAEPARLSPDVHCHRPLHRTAAGVEAEGHPRAALEGDELLVPDQPAHHVDVPGGADLVGRGHDLHARSMDGGRGVEELEITSSVCSGSLAHTRSPGVAMRAPMACFMVSWLVITSS